MKVGDTPPKVPVPFPPDFDPDESRCLVCGDELDTGWECTGCGADHYFGVKLIISEMKGKPQ